ncbi:MAG: alanine racemase, partial [Candidatus Izimaplasma sp.]|nr:alanine racemase [Candidatus Izimaplasma bacterium]
KANAYGHGVLEVVKYLVDRKVDYFAVSLLEEALELRKEFKSIRILIMGIVDREQFRIASENNFTITISNFDQLNEIEKLKDSLTVHIKVDTGMNRLGFKFTDDILKVSKVLEGNSHINLEGIYTHFATADGNKNLYDLQLNRFNSIIEMLNYKFEMIHASNSSSAIKYESKINFTTHVRLGISLYGLTLDEEITFLKNTYSLITHISEIKHLKIGEKVGYGGTYTAIEEEIIGILPLGYADGFIRQNQNGDVEINNRRYPIIGRICMDQMFVKIDEIVTKDDEVILFGGIVSIDEVADRLKTINYEVVCQITCRVPKLYIK